MKPENEFPLFMDPPVFMLSVLGLPLLMEMLMGLVVVVTRGADLGPEEDLVGEDGPSERRFWV